MGFLTTTDSLRGAGVAVNRGFTIDPLRPYIESTFDECLRPFVGDAFADLLLADTGMPAPVRARVLPYVERCLAKLAFAAYLPFAEVQIDNDGITVSAVEGRKNAPERQIRDLRGSLLETGWNQLERLLAYLQSYPADYPLHHDYLALQTPSLLPSALLFSQYYGIFNSRLTYAALKPTADRLERDTLVPYLADRWAVLVGSPTTANDRKLQGKLRTWLAFQTIAEAIPTLAVKIDGKGVRAIFGNPTDQLEYFTPASDAQVDRLVQRCREQADQTWNECLTLMTPAPTEPSGRGLIGAAPGLFFI